MSGRHKGTEARRHEGSAQGLVALILAAGASRRMGTSKPLMRGESEQTLLARAIITARQAGLAPLVAVRTGDQEVAVEAQRAGARVVEVAGAAEGMSVSIRAGVAAVATAPEAKGVLILLADQWRITADDLRGLSAAWAGSGTGLAAARYEGVLGVPAIFGREYFPVLLGLSGDEGARQFLRERESEVTAVEMPAAAADADVPGDLGGRR